MSGRPRSEPDDRVTTNVRLPKDLHARLVDAASERQVSANLLMTVAVRELLDRLLPVDDIVWTRRGDMRPSDAEPQS